MTDSGHFASACEIRSRGRDSAVGSDGEKTAVSRRPFLRLEHFRGIAIDEYRERAVLLLLEDERISIDALNFDGSRERLGTLDFKIARDDAGGWTAQVCVDGKTVRGSGLRPRTKYTLSASAHTRRRRHGFSAGAPVAWPTSCATHWVDSWLLIDTQGNIELWDSMKPFGRTALRGPIGDRQTLHR